MHTKDLLRHDVCRLFAEGCSLTDIPDAVTKMRGTVLIPNDVYRLLREGALLRHLSYQPRSYPEVTQFLTKHLKEFNKAQPLREIQALYPSIDAVATAAANRMYDLILDRVYGGQYETTICISGGATTAQIVDKLYSLLLHPDPRLQKILRRLRAHRDERVRVRVPGESVGPDPFRPERITLNFRSIAPMFDPDNLELSPNGSLLIFKRQEFVQLHGDVLDVDCCGAPEPSILSCDDYEKERDIEPKKTLMRDAGQAHLVVTSASTIDCHLSMLKCLYGQTDKPDEALAGLKARGCIGNFLVYPVTKDGPMDIAELRLAMGKKHGIFPIHPNNVLLPFDVPPMISRGCEVILALASPRTSVDEDRRVRELIEMVTRRGLITRLFCSMSLVNAFDQVAEVDFGDFLNQSVARHFTEGMTPLDIQKTISSDNIPSAGRRTNTAKVVGRQAVYKVLDRPSFHKDVIYRATTFDCLADQLEARYSSLREIRVTRTHMVAVSELAAAHTYRLIVDRLIKQLTPIEEALDKLDDQERAAQLEGEPGTISVTVGFGAGRMINAVIDCLYQHLVFPDDTMTDLHRRLRETKRQIALHFKSLTPMLEPSNLQLSPTGTLIAFKGRELGRQKDWLTVHVSGVKNAILPKARVLQPGQTVDIDRPDTLEEPPKSLPLPPLPPLDIVVATGCSLRRKSDLLNFFYFDKNVRARARAWLTAKGVFGSVMLYPFTTTGSLDPKVLWQSVYTETPLYPNTLVKPMDLPALIAKGTDVLFMLSGEVADEDDLPYQREIVREEAEIFKLVCSQRMATRAFVGTAIAHELLTEF